MKGNYLQIIQSYAILVGKDKTQKSYVRMKGESDTRFERNRALYVACSFGFFMHRIGLSLFGLRQHSSEPFAHEKRRTKFVETNVLH